MNSFNKKFKPWDFPSWLSSEPTQLASIRIRVQSLASLSGLGIRYCHELWCRSQTWDRTLLWLWCRPVATTPIGPRLWGPSCVCDRATPDPSCVCDLHHSSRQCQILNRLSEARDQTCNLMVPSWIRFCWL